ncbi:hypothetical protein H4Q26_004018 [Puccinia striiformis f. sp. tritici PST-130]|nr:hypothetical protein H4Q26_004018 [Puccinia striiformis f. sp. tritici PST-130]
MASPASRPSPTPSTPGSQAPTASAAVTINQPQEERITAVQAARAKAMKKQAFEQRIKNRGKRTADPSDTTTSTATKKTKTEEEDNAYLREVRKLQGHSLRDEGAGVRALVK